MLYFYISLRVPDSLLVVLLMTVVDTLGAGGGLAQPESSVFQILDLH